MDSSWASEYKPGARVWLKSHAKTPRWYECVVADADKDVSTEVAKRRPKGRDGKRIEDVLVFHPKAKDPLWEWVADPKRIRSERPRLLNDVPLKEKTTKGEQIECSPKKFQLKVFASHLVTISDSLPPSAVEDSTVGYWEGFSRETAQAVERGEYSDFGRLAAVLSRQVKQVCWEQGWWGRRKAAFEEDTCGRASAAMDVEQLLEVLEQRILFDAPVTAAMWAKDNEELEQGAWKEWKKPVEEAGADLEAPSQEANGTARGSSGKAPSGSGKASSSSGKAGDNSAKGASGSGKPPNGRPPNRLPPGRVSGSGSGSGGPSRAGKRKAQEAAVTSGGKAGKAAKPSAASSGGVEDTPEERLQAEHAGAGEEDTEGPDLGTISMQLQRACCEFVAAPEEAKDIQAASTIAEQLLDHLQDFWRAHDRGWQREGAALGRGWAANRASVEAARKAVIPAEMLKDVKDALRKKRDKGARQLAANRTARSRSIYDPTAPAPAAAPLLASGATGHVREPASQRWAAGSSGAACAASEEGPSPLAAAATPTGAAAPSSATPQATGAQLSPKAAEGLLYSDIAMKDSEKQPVGATGRDSVVSASADVPTEDAGRKPGAINGAAEAGTNSPAPMEVDSDGDGDCDRVKRNADRDAPATGTVGRGLMSVDAAVEGAPGLPGPLGDGDDSDERIPGLKGPVLARAASSTDDSPTGGQQGPSSSSLLPQRGVGLAAAAADPASATGSQGGWGLLAHLAAETAGTAPPPAGTDDRPVSAPQAPRIAGATDSAPLPSPAPSAPPSTPIACHLCKLCHLPVIDPQPRGAPSAAPPPPSTPSPGAPPASAPSSSRRPPPGDFPEPVAQYVELGPGFCVPCGHALKGCVCPPKHAPASAATPKAPPPHCRTPSSAATAASTPPPVAPAPVPGIAAHAPPAAPETAQTTAAATATASGDSGSKPPTAGPPASSSTRTEDPREGSRSGGGDAAGRSAAGRPTFRPIVVAMKTQRRLAAASPLAARLPEDTLPEDRAWRATPSDDGAQGDRPPEELASVVHQRCAEWSPQCHWQAKGGGPMAFHTEAITAACTTQVRKGLQVEVDRGKRHKCSVCRLDGATIGCFKATCIKNFHYKCAEASGCLLVECETQDNYIYCPAHSFLFGSDAPDGGASKKPAKKAPPGAKGRAEQQAAQADSKGKGPKVPAGGGSPMSARGQEIVARSRARAAEASHRARPRAPAAPLPPAVTVAIQEDLSGGLERVPVRCVADLARKGDPVPPPPPPFQYVSQRWGLEALGLQMDEQAVVGCECAAGCGCGEPCEGAEAAEHPCRHVHDFWVEAPADKPYWDWQGASMRRRFPYNSRRCLDVDPENCQWIYECNAMCACPPTCPNRVLQRGLSLALEVFHTGAKGWGVRTREAIARGQFVVEYVGEVITNAEANVRGERYDLAGCSYLMDLDKHLDDTTNTAERDHFAIDANSSGNVSRFINHSCDPNLAMYSVLYDTIDIRLHHIGLYAIRDIAAGTELSYDYKYQVIEKKKSSEGLWCKCGAAACRGRLV